MIHASPRRMWYVEGFQIPELQRQGIEPVVWNDSEGKGNLFACVESFASCECDGGTWHLQDDVLPAGYFSEYAEDYDTVVCGFCNSNYEQGTPKTGYVLPPLMWWSFPCIYIPNKIAVEFAKWFCTEAFYNPLYEKEINSRKNDDFLFKSFIREKHNSELILNFAPHLVEHVDYLLGGSIVNQFRGHTSRAYYFDDEEAMKKLNKWLMTRE